MELRINVLEKFPILSHAHGDPGKCHSGWLNGLSKEMMMVNNQKFNRLTFILWLCDADFTLYFFFMETTKSNRNWERERETRKGKKGNKTTRILRKRICGCISIEYITQINAINISRIESYNRIHTHTQTTAQHSKWFDISFMCMIWCFASICITFQRSHVFFFFWFNWMHFAFLWFQTFFYSHLFLCARGKSKETRAKRVREKLTK